MNYEYHTPIHRIIIVQEHKHPHIVAKSYSSPSLFLSLNPQIFHCNALHCTVQKKHMFTFKIMMCP